MQILPYVFLAITALYALIILTKLVSLPRLSGKPSGLVFSDKIVKNLIGLVVCCTAYGGLYLIEHVSILLTQD